MKIKIPAIDDGKLYKLITVSVNNTLLTTQGSLDQHSFPYVVIDGLVFHSRSVRKCASCFEHYWVCLNESWQEFSEGWVVNELQM